MKQGPLLIPPCSQDTKLQSATHNNNGPPTQRRAQNKSGRSAAPTSNKRGQASPIAPLISREATQPSTALDVPAPLSSQRLGKAAKSRETANAAAGSKRPVSKADMDDSTSSSNGIKKLKRGHGTTTVQKPAKQTARDSETRSKAKGQETPVIDVDGVKSKSAIQRKKTSKTGGKDEGVEAQHDGERQAKEGRQVAKAKRPKAKKAQADDRDVPVDRLLNLPTEMWIEVFSYLYPSELMRFGLCSKRIHAFVREQPFWAKISSAAGLPKPNKKFSSYYEVVRFHDEVVCEQCLGLSTPKHVAAARSDHPLPVQLDWNKQGQKIHLCRQCRGPYLTEFPQYDIADPNVIEEHEQTIGKTYAGKLYALSDEQLVGLPHKYQRNPHHWRAPPMRLYTIKAVQDFARLFHGGFMGLAETKKPFKPPRCR
ncbi:hypothetical protein DFQ27_003144 [Actinomortierella ambigua]|uniref:F-box domain-containing protein n=1 Tax=Actinomortierella ambigua TaxID=1343610 RepID=A0A9P6Q900_9FUNG|nr:hypothetical protein DFQ27_003144 [Actinomortierella ambigua]